MIKRYAMFALFLVNGGLHAELSSDFLVKVRQKFNATEGAPIAVSDFTNLSNEESAFVENTLNYDYTDIFKAALPKTSEVYSYNLLNLRSTLAKAEERLLHGSLDCRMVHTDGKVFIEKKLRQLRNPIPDLMHHEGCWQFSYCTGVDKDSDPNSVLYYFHGASGNPYNFLHRNSTYAVRKNWREMGKLPKWISISIGNFGHLAERHKEERFFNIIVPYIEKKIGFQSRPRHRFGFGISQGGGNVVHALLKKQDFFDAAVAVCPAITAVPAFATPEEIKTYKKRTLSSALFLRFAFHILPKDFWDSEYWYKHVDALRLGQRFFNEKTPPLYIQTSANDQFGMQEGGQILALLARTQGAPVRFEEIQGGHCVLRPKAIASFLRGFQQDSI